MEPAPGRAVTPPVPAVTTLPGAEASCFSDAQAAASTQTHNIQGLEEKRADMVPTSSGAERTGQNHHPRSNMRSQRAAGDGDRAVAVAIRAASTFAPALIAIGRK